MTTGPKKIENRGGYRPNAGRKRIPISEKAVREMIKSAKKMAKKNGRTIDDILLGIIYNDDPKTVGARLQAIRIFKEYTITKKAERDTPANDNREGIRLPPMLPDPGKALLLKKD